MVMMQPLHLPAKDPPLQLLTQPVFNRGVITLIDPSKLPDGALAAGDNIMLFEDGAPAPRWGTAWFGNAIPNGAPIDGAAAYTLGGRNYIIAVGGGSMYYSTDDCNSWTLCTGGSFTAGKKVFFEQAGSSITQQAFLYAVDGTDSMLRFNGTSTLQVYANINTPSLTSVVASSGIAGTGYTYYYRISAVNQVGFTAASPSVQGAVIVTKTRNQWNVSQAEANYNTLTWTSSAGVIRYDIFEGDVQGQEVYIDSVAAPASPTTIGYNDYGNSPEVSTVLAPGSNTSTGPTLKDISLVGDRIWGTGDPVNPFRVWWSGSGPYMGYFSQSYDGGYIDLQYGSQFNPVAVKDYEDGRGNPMTTVYCDSADKLGCVWQVSLSTATVENLYSYTVPTAYKLPGSRGTPAPLSIVNVINDFMYYNSQGYYNLGPRAQFLNLLSTDEESVNIRPTVRTINTPYANNVAGHFYLDKVFMSAPVGESKVNNVVQMYDTEYKAWMPTAFTYGVERFFDYGDNANGNLHMLMWKPGDDRLSEISESIQGDYGTPFRTNLVTGLMPVNKRNRFDFMFVEEMDIEFSNPQGIINISLNAINRPAGLVPLANTQIVIQNQSANSGFSSFGWSTLAWSDCPTIQVYSQPSIKGYLPILQDINAYQLDITTNSLPTSYRLRTIQMQGTIDNAGYPRQWRLPRL